MKVSNFQSIQIDLNESSDFFKEIFPIANLKESIVSTIVFSFTCNFKIRFRI